MKGIQQIIIENKRRRDGYLLLIYWQVTAVGINPTAVILGELQFDNKEVRGEALQFYMKAEYFLLRK